MVTTSGKPPITLPRSVRGGTGLSSMDRPFPQEACMAPRGTVWKQGGVCTPQGKDMIEKYRYIHCGGRDQRPREYRQGVNYTVRGWGDTPENTMPACWGEEASQQKGGREGCILTCQKDGVWTFGEQDLAWLGGGRKEKQARQGVRSGAGCTQTRTGRMLTVLCCTKLVL
jgi:hypothetical protein